jgi:Ser/Thr protein kinase RdoA (MazF antagonist)
MEHFYSLTPEAVLDAIEAALGSGVRATGRCLSLHSLENRVYDIELEDERHVVAKFYRPGRWSRAAILDEHRFLAELADAEVPVISPLRLTTPEGPDATLASTPDGILFALFDKVKGRLLQELDDAQLSRVGRFLGRIHNVGASADAPQRARLSAERFGAQSLAYLLENGAIDIQVQGRYQRAATALVELVAPLLTDQPVFRLHGDCHQGNILWREDSPLFLDFDDMIVGPAVQDIWMVVRGRDAEAQRQRAVLVSGYEQMRRFDATTLRLIEPLRALRMLHYTAWIARRYGDPTFQRMFPDFTTYRFWAEETAAIEEQLQMVREAVLPTN